MTRRVRMALLCVGVIGMAAFFVLAWLQLPPFGGSWHPYRDLAVTAAYAHSTANVVSSINFDQRGFDTFGEESILVASIAGVAVLLRAGHEEERVKPDDRGRLLDSTRVLVYVFLPLTLLIGVDVVTHGAVTPGGGFQGGVVLATGLHLLYVGGRFPLLERFRPLDLFPPVESAGLLLYAAIGLAGLALGGSFLANIIPQGTMADLVSSGTVPLLSVAVGMAVVSSVILLLAHFLDQALVIREKDPAPSDDATDRGAAA
ncbi:MnhB domain-containing protein [Leifsonia shinshuensis]|uniref:Multicomponent Na+:H+ antiporter subunit B n=1 Tax=Leifsonia shinshuensis TaxID=150026 RepID=A0A853CS55_9MICO|nr:MnhB domain-containing protein [Leifsonia shinshuensis]NYJ22301.1 multicomponent Na+:H+ antiporter subunit B [Leifsonia shinshuensis]